jgi:APA family basic amino acid/polyamine antiporter
LAQKLQRNLSLTGAIATITGLVVGPSIFVLIPTLAGMTGPSLWIAAAVSAIPALFCILYALQLGSAVPVTGCHYVTITRWISPLAGWIGSLCGAIAIIGTNCIVAWGFAAYIGVYVPGVPLAVWALAIVLIFGLINYLGVKLVGWSQIIMMVIFVLAMLLFGIVGAINANPDFLKPLFPKGVEPFIIVCVIITFLWTGFLGLTEVGGEIMNPRRNIPRALIVSFFIVLVLYVFQTFALVAIMQWSEVGKIGATAILKAAEQFLPSGAVIFIALGAIMAMLTTINALMLIAARDFTAWGRDGMIPTIFSHINRRFSTPDVSLLTITVLSLIGVLFAATLDKYATVNVLALMIVQILGATVTWLLPKRAPDIFNRAIFKFSSFWRWFTWIGCLLLFGLIFLFGLVIDWKLGLIFVGVIAAGLIYWFARKAYLKGRGIDLDKQLGRITGATLEELEER